MATYKKIRSENDLLNWINGTVPYGMLSRTLKVNPGIYVPSHKSLYRRNPAYHIDVQNAHDAIQWDGTIAPENVGTSLLFKNTIPATGLLPNKIGEAPAFGEGGMPYLGNTWRKDQSASIHGHMGQRRRHSSWWDDGRDHHWSWIQAMVDSCPRVGGRLNDAEFLMHKGTYWLDRPVNFDMRYGEILGMGRDNTVFNFLPDQWAPLWPKAMFVMNSAHQGGPRGTGGFETRIVNITINGGNLQDFACFWGAGRIEESSMISRITVFNCPQWCIWVDGFNGLVVNHVHVAGGGQFDYPAGTTPEGEPIVEQEGVTFFEKQSSSLGQGHCRVHDCWLNVKSGTFLRMGNGNIWVDNVDTEGCDQILYQKWNASNVSMRNVNHFIGSGTTRKPLFEIESTLDEDNKLRGSSPCFTNIESVRYQGPYGGAWIKDHLASPSLDHPALAGGQGRAPFYLHRFSRGIGQHNTVGSRYDDLNGHRPVRIFWGNASNPSRTYYYNLQW